MTVKLGLLGKDISHSKMPDLQRYLGDLANVSIEYDLIEQQDSANFDAFKAMDSARQMGYQGLNITYPFKQQIYQAVISLGAVTDIDIGSCNTLRFEGTRIIQANTDYSGFLKGYRYRLGNQLPGKVVVIGAGGVARAITFALAKLGCEKLYLFDLDDSRARSLADALSRMGVEVLALAESEVTEAARQSDGLINCTNMGSYSHRGCAIKDEWFGSPSWAFDAVYTPLETEFLSKCRGLGLQCLSGFDLWFFQGVDAFRIFTGIDIDVTQQVMDTTLEWLK